MSQTAAGRRLRPHGAVVLVTSVVFLVGAGGCSTDGPGSSDASSVGSQRSTVTTEAGEAGAIATQMVAQSDGQVEVWNEPSDDAQSQMLSAATEASGQLTFLVLEEGDDGWLQVELPTPPPGSSGWVREGDVTLSRHRYSIEIARGAHTLTVFAGGVEALSGSVAIGPDTPPAGTHTFIKELLIPPDGTPYGVRVYGLAGWTSNEQQFGAGAGVVGIHAAAPAALGRDTLTGAIGTDAAVLARLADNIGLPLGTPVSIIE
jgi:hypothetical protein